MSDNQKFLAGIILGAAAGTFVTLFLQSQKGKELLENVKDTAQTAGDEVRSTLNNLEFNFSNIIQKGKNLIADITNKQIDDFDEIFS